MKLSSQLSSQPSYLSPVEPEEQRLYDHWLHSVQSDSPSQLIERFRHLFIEGTNYTDPDVERALQVIVNSKEANQKFKYVLNRCCQIIINSWQAQGHQQEATLELLNLLDISQAQTRTYSRYAQRLQLLVKNFYHTEQYLTLNRLARVISQATEPSKKESELIGSLLGYYPYLYEHCLLSEDSSNEHKKQIRKLRLGMQKRFELRLSQYVTYQVRLAEIARHRQFSHGAGRIISPVEKPSLLNEKRLAIALKHFMGNSLGGRTYSELAHNFIFQSQQVSSYGVFKEQFYQYLTFCLDSKYCKSCFHERLYEYLQNILPQYNQQKNSELLVLRTCTKLLNFLVVESQQRLDHHIYIDAVTNLGSTKTVGLLLKIVLFCPKVKPHLEKRFAILFNHYEMSSRREVPWLLKSLEILHLALSIHFGEVDLSYLKRIM